MSDSAGEPGEPSRRTGATDSGATDAGSADSGATDAGSADSGATDAGSAGSESGAPGSPPTPEGEPPAAPQPPVGWLPGGADTLFGAGATATEAYGLLTVDVPAEGWIAALEAARDTLGCRYFDWLSAVDEPGEGYRICAHLVAPPAGHAPAAGDAAPGQADGSAAGSTAGSAAPAPGTPRTGPGSVRRLLLRTTVSHDRPALPTATGVYAGAAWHERETHEMFGVDFPGHPHLVPLLLPDGFEGHPLRKEFVLAARVAKAWPGAKEPGESDAHGGPKRRQMLPPGVPDPNEWGPLKGQLPPAPARGRAAGGARPSRRAAGAGTDRPRRNRSASQGSASQRAAGTGGERAAGGERGAGRAPGADQPWNQNQNQNQNPTADPGPSVPERPDPSAPSGPGPATGEEPPSGGEGR